MNKSKEIIENMYKFNNTATLIQDLQRLGLKKGMTVIVDSSLNNIGWVAGGISAINHALMNVVTEEGTIIMASHFDYSSSDFKINPICEMEYMVECFITYEGVKFSSYSKDGFVAWGKNADLIIEDNSEDNSIIKKIYDLDGYILLLGVGHDANTSLYLSIKEFEDFGSNPKIFNYIGEAFESKYTVSTSKFGNTYSKLMKQRELIDFGIEYLKKGAFNTNLKFKSYL